MRDQGDNSETHKGLQCPIVMLLHTDPRLFFKEKNLIFHNSESDLLSLSQKPGLYPLWLIRFTVTKIKSENALWWFEYPCLEGNGTIRRCVLVEIGVALLKEVCHCGGEVWDSPPSSWRQSFLGCPPIKMQNSQLLLQHCACLDTAVLSTLTIMDWTWNL